MEDIIVRLTRLPHKIEGTTSVDEEGDYNVYLNTDICDEKQRKALRHELSHIRHNHFYDERSLGEDEEEAESDSADGKDLLPWVDWGGVV